MTELKAASPHPPALVESRPLHDTVVRDLTRRVVRGELAPHTALPTEPVLAKRYGVSRTVIRDAVRNLVEKGLLSVRQGSGMRVRTPEHWDHLDPLVLFEQVRGGQGAKLLDEILEVRRLVEVQAAVWAAERRTHDDLAALEGALRGMRGALNDGAAFTTLDVTFHEHVMRAAGNRLLRDTLRPIAETLRGGRFLTAQRPEGIAESMRGHELIFAAIQAGDAAGAREAMSDHLAQFEHDIRERLLQV